MDRMNSPPWRIAIERALTLHGDEPAARWLQLATTAPDGWPAVRTVVFRGFLDDRDMLRFTTDTRSAKAEHLARDARGEACWYFHGSREQFRLAGRLDLIGADHSDPALLAARFAQWAGLSPPARMTFAWPEPGALLADPRHFRVSPPEPEEDPPPSFGLLLLDPERVDHLDLRPEPHARFRYDRSKIDNTAFVWETIAVNP